MNGTALIVDDTPTNVHVLVACLSAAGLRTLVAEDGESALEQLQFARPDIILLDVMMPGIDGVETCRRIKARPETRDIPIIFMTAVADMTNKLRGFEAGAVDYITKPYHHDEVVSRIRTQLTLRSQRLELESMLEHRNRFMRIAAHDIRNPLAVVLAWSEMALAEASDGGHAELESMLQRILTSARRTRDIIEDFLSLQVIRGRGETRALGPVDLGAAVSQVVEQQRYAAEQKGIEIQVEVDPAVPSALGDGTRTHQVLTNYVSNAVKYSPQGSRVTVALRPGDIGPRVEVRDQGPGIPVANRDSLFVEFAKIPNKPTGGETSTGLGLAIVKHLVEMQGGCVGAEFPAERGSVFWFELPCATAIVSGPPGG
jgi:signal transduction histidine kinase